MMRLTGVSDLATVNALRELDQRLEAFEKGTLDLGGRRIANAGVGISPTDLATLAQVEAAVSLLVPTTLFNYITEVLIFPDFIASGPAHSRGAVPDPGAVAGATKFLREDATWVVPPGGAGAGDSITVNGVAVVDADFDDATPAAPADGVNVRWQKDALSPANISANVREAAAAQRGVLQLAGDLTGTAAAPAVANDAITNAKLRNSAARSVIGASGVAGDPADIVAGFDGDVLRRSGASIGWGAIPETSVTGLTTDLGNALSFAHLFAVMGG